MIRRPDAEAAWVNWLREGGFTTAATRLQGDHYDEMIRISRTGGRRLNVVQDEVHMLVETWHRDPFLASQLAHLVAERVEAARDGTFIADGIQARAVSTTGPLEFPDPHSGLARYQFTFSCTLRKLNPSPQTPKLAKLASD